MGLTFSKIDCCTFSSLNPIKIETLLIERQYDPKCKFLPTSEHTIQSLNPAFNTTIWEFTYFNELVDLSALIVTTSVVLVIKLCSLRNPDPNPNKSLIFECFDAVWKETL